MIDKSKLKDFVQDLKEVLEKHDAEIYFSEDRHFDSCKVVLFIGREEYSFEEGSCEVDVYELNKLEGKLNEQ